MRVLAGGIQSLITDHVFGAGPDLAPAFAAADPFPHIVMDDVIGADPDEFLADFPDADWPGWCRYRDQYQPGKLICSDVRAMPPLTAALVRELCEPAFLCFLEQLTGIPRLVPDPYFEGGGLHAGGPGATLTPHTDFHVYPRLRLYRQVNVLLYLNPEWLPDDGGALELFDAASDFTNSARSIDPVWGRMVIFRTDDRSPHGFTRPVADGRFRRSIALYYYTATEADIFAGDTNTYWKTHGDTSSSRRRVRLAAYRSLLTGSRALSMLAHRCNPKPWIQRPARGAVGLATVRLMRRGTFVTRGRRGHRTPEEVLGSPSGRRGTILTASITPSAQATSADLTDRCRPRPFTALNVPVHRRGLEVIVVVLLLTGAVAAHWGTLGDRLTERHDFRQTQTAASAVDFAAHGIDLLHPRVPVFGPRSEVPYEFPLFQAIATIPMNFGIDADAAMRGTALACFLLTAVLLYGLLRRVAGRPAAVGALVAFLFSPFGLQWSHASLIEYLATAGAVGFVWAGIEWRERKHWAFVVLAVVAGSVAMLVKITTGIFWILPLLLYTAAREAKGLRAWIRERVEPGMIVAVSVPVFAGLLWTRHADAIKGAHAATKWITSSNLQAWNFGTVAQRLVLDNWLTVFNRIELLLVGRPLFFVLVIVALWWGRAQRFWLGLVLVIAFSPAVFFNLYVVHDYYLAALSPALAALVGLATVWLWSHRPHRVSPALCAAVLVAVWVFWVVAPAWSYVLPMYDPPADPYVAAATELRRTTPVGAPVVYLGEDWNPTTPYYADRPGLMLPPALVADPEVLDRMPRQGYRYVFSFAPDTDPIEVLSRWRWVGIVGPRTYLVGSRRADVASAPVFASTAPISSIDDSALTTVDCGASHLAVSDSGAPTRVVVSADRSHRLRIRVRDGLAPLPRVGAIYLRSGALSCTGATSIGVSVDSQ